MRYVRYNPEQENEEEDDEKRAAEAAAAAAAYSQKGVETAATTFGKMEQRKIQQKLLTEAATKAGLKSAVKIGSKTVSLGTGVGIALGAAEAAPVVVRESYSSLERSKKSATKAREAAKQGRYKEAAKEAGKGVLRGMLDQKVLQAKGAAAFFGSRELADLIPSSDKIVSMIPGQNKNPRYVRSNPDSTSENLQYLLSLMLCLRTAYLYLHWNARTYAEHLQYERLYQTLDEDIDTLAELSVKQIGPLKQMVGDIDASLSSVRMAETEIQKIAQTLVVAMGEKTADNMAFENFLLNLIQNRQRVLYLLQLSG